MWLPDEAEVVHFPAHWESWYVGHALASHQDGREQTADQLRARIPGWGVDLDPKDRPSVPKERFDPSATGAHWDFPERQPEKWPRERSIEHKFLTPVFGTCCPPKGLSG